MSIEVEATYENGVLKPDQPLPLKERQRITISIRPAADRVAASFGLVRWTGEPAALDYLAHSPENDMWGQE